MNRQQFRFLLLMISLLLFPITIYYFSPYLILVGAMGGIVTGSFVVFVLLFLFSIIFSRIFCGYICPMSGLQECAGRINKKAARQGFFNAIKYIIWFVWMTAIVMIFLQQNNKITLDVFYRTDHGISVSQIYAYVIYYGVIILVFLLALLFGKRTFCHSVCWMAPFMVIGMKVGKLLHLPRLEVKANSKQCISCNKCNQACPMGLSVSEMAKVGKVDNTECILCAECIDICPKKVLYYSMKNKG